MTIFGVTWEVARELSASTFRDASLVAIVLTFGAVGITKKERDDLEEVAARNAERIGFTRRHWRQIRNRRGHVEADIAMGLAPESCEKPIVLFRDPPGEYTPLALEGRHERSTPMWVAPRAKRLDRLRRLFRSEPPAEVPLPKMNGLIDIGSTSIGRFRAFFNRPLD